MDFDFEPMDFSYYFPPTGLIDETISETNNYAERKLEDKSVVEKFNLDTITSSAKG